MNWNEWLKEALLMLCIYSAPIVIIAIMIWSMQ